MHDDSKERLLFIDLKKFLVYDTLFGGYIA